MFFMCINTLSRIKNGFTIFLFVILYFPDKLNATNLYSDTVGIVNGKHLPIVPYLLKNGKYIFVDSANMEPINKTEYDNCTLLYEGMAGIQKNNKCGFVNEQGKVIIVPKYQNLDKFSENVCGVKWGGKWGFINKEGKIIFNNDFNSIFAFEDNKAFVNYKNGLYYLDKKTKKRVESDGFIANVIYMNNYWLKPNTLDVFYDPHSISVFGTMDNFSDLTPKEINGKYGYVNSIDSIVISPQFDNAMDFEGQYAKVEIGGKWGLINKTGNWFIEPNYASIDKQTDGNFKVSIGKYIQKKSKLIFIGKYGLVNDKGIEILKPIYDQIDVFINGFVKIEENNSYFYADKIGRTYKQ